MSEWIKFPNVFDRWEDDPPYTADGVAGFAAGIAFVLSALGWDRCAKSYDPLAIDEEGKIAHTYAFDLEDGGRHHPYETLEDLSRVLATEALFELWVLDGEPPRYRQLMEGLGASLPDGKYAVAPEGVSYFPRWFKSRAEMDEAPKGQVKE